jgi:drug/metabolite transporter (DMT)-like permease
VVVSGFIGWILWAWVNATRGVARTAPLLYGVPPVAGVVAWLMVGEAYTGIKLFGAALALAGVAWTQLGGGRSDAS